MIDDQKKAAARDKQANERAPKIKWDMDNAKSSYSNVCNVSFTREEVVLLFGINQAWQSDQKDVTIQVTDRIIISPFAAKRLGLIINNILKEYESRFGKLEDIPQAPSMKDSPASSKK